MKRWSPEDPLESEAWPYSIHIRALGGFDLRIDERPVCPTRKPQVVPQRMLEALTALGGRSVERSRLTDILWPDAHGDAGNQAFDTTLHRLRKMLGYPSAIVLSDGKVSLASDHVWTDFWAVEHLLRMDRQSVRTDVSDRFQRARRLIELYRGPLHAGSEDPVWVVPRARLHERVVQTIERTAEATAAAGDLARARLLFSDGIGMDPTVEVFYQGAMRCALQMGAKAEVARTYEQCRRVLHAAFSVEPSETTRDLWLRGTRSAT